MSSQLVPPSQPNKQSQSNDTAFNRQNVESFLKTISGSRENKIAQVQTHFGVKKKAAEAVYDRLRPPEKRAPKTDICQSCGTVHDGTICPEQY